jgi:hypothetical protein
MATRAEVDVALRDGSTVHVRPATRDDVDALLAFLQGSRPSRAGSASSPRAVGGRRAHRHIGDVPGPVDLAILAVPAARAVSGAVYPRRMTAAAPSARPSLPAASAGAHQIACA